MSSTRLLAQVLHRTVRSVAALVGPKKSLKVLGHVRYMLITRTKIEIGGQSLNLAILDRTGAYWAQAGTTSEPETLNWIDGFSPDDVFYDIGANVGLYSLYASHSRKCRSVALEPNPFSFNALAHNILLNGLDERITPLCIAAGNSDELFDLGISGDQSGTVGNSLAEDNDTRRKLSTMVTTIDRLVMLTNMPFPTHIKIDVDGIEGLILAGARTTLADPRVLSVLVEVVGRSRDEVTALRPVIEECGLVLSEMDSSETNWVFRRK